MGLIGSLLAMLYCGGSGVYLSPIAFILNPCLWLLLASTYKATHLQGPNFAYALVLRRFATFPAKEKLALQSIQHIFDAAEPIVVSTVKQFIETFAPYGLRRDAMTGGYGLAESCVYVCDGGHQALSVCRETLEKEGHGALFYIDCYPGVWAEDDRPVMAGASRRALQTEDFAVFVRAPSGVEFSESDEALAARYQALSSQMEYLATHIKEIE